jgi:arsenate reductase (glutaredoxin)
MLRIYGIKNCDTVQKALKLLDRKRVHYVFHDYKVAGLERATIENWLQHLPLDKLVNSRSTTFKELPEADKARAKDRDHAIGLMLEHTSIIKRPVWDFGNGKLLLGWDEDELEKML